MSKFNKNFIWLISRIKDGVLTIMAVVSSEMPLWASVDMGVYFNIISYVRENQLKTSFGLFSQVQDGLIIIFFFKWPPFHVKIMCRYLNLRSLRVKSVIPFKKKIQSTFKHLKVVQ